MDNFLRYFYQDIGRVSTFAKLSFDKPTEVITAHAGQVYHYADAIVAPVGKSEHHLGICVDLSLYFEGEGFLQNNTNFDRIRPVFEAHVHPHLSKFGFILRYPLGKEEITGYPYEPWHIRYVGCEAAREMAQKGLTMEQWCFVES